MRLRSLRLASRALGVVAFVGCFALVLDHVEPGVGGSRATAQSRTTARPTAHPTATLPAVLTRTSERSAEFGGVPTVGAVFSAGDTGFSRHYCTGSVVDSPGGNLIVTAAHCLLDPASGVSDAASVVFVPGYHDGVHPYGDWQSTSVTVDPHWSSDSDQDYDVAFVTVRNTAHPDLRLQDVVGAQVPAFGDAARPGTVSVIGYPSSGDKPIGCRNSLKPYSATQSEFDCAGFADGSSGGPLLTGLDPDTGRGTLVGVIGGYQEGGDSDDVSYAAYFGDAVQALYREATGK
jgi:V8-like Glu-specific endopeptidase